MEAITIGDIFVSKGKVYKCTDIYELDEEIEYPIVARDFKGQVHFFAQCECAKILFHEQ